MAAECLLVLRSGTDGDVEALRCAEALDEEQLGSPAFDLTVLEVTAITNPCTLVENNCRTEPLPRTFRCRLQQGLARWSA